MSYSLGHEDVVTTRRSINLFEPEDAIASGVPAHGPTVRLYPAQFSADGIAHAHSLLCICQHPGKTSTTGEAHVLTLGMSSRPRASLLRTAEWAQALTCLLKVATHTV